MLNGDGSKGGGLITVRKPMARNRILAVQKVLFPADARFLSSEALTEVLVGVRVVGRQSHGAPQPLFHFLGTAALWGW